MNIALIFAGGSGSRMNCGATPKQFLKINGIPILIHTLKHFEAHPQIDAICVVCLESWIPRLRGYLNQFGFEKVGAVVPGGSCGQESIRNGLRQIRGQYGVAEDTVVLIHDGVRPLINAQLITDNIASVRRYGSGVTVARATETVICLEDGGKFSRVPDRSQCRIARAPQSFYLRDILAVHDRAWDEGVAPYMMDSASLMTHYGYVLSVVEGPAENIKVTTQADLHVCRAYLQNGEEDLGL